MLFGLNEGRPGKEMYTPAEINSFNKENKKPRPYIFVNVREAPVTLITSIVPSGAATKVILITFIKRSQKRKYSIEAEFKNQAAYCKVQRRSRSPRTFDVVGKNGLGSHKSECPNNM